MQTVDQAHQRDDEISVLRVEWKQIFSSMPKGELVDLMVNVAEAIDSAGAAMLAEEDLDPANKLHVWLYGILVGWNAFSETTQKRLGWQDYTVKRMQRYNATVRRFLGR